LLPSSRTELPLVSVILPTYNRAKLLKRSLGSVLSQTYSNWELVLWDDGSRDDTAAVVSSVRDGRIKYHHDVNRGMSYALNRAVGISAGDYVAFLDDDDEWTSDKLAAQVRVLEDTRDIDVLFTNFTNLNLVTGSHGSGFAQCREAMDLMTVEEIEPTVYRIIRGFAESVMQANFVAFDTAMVRRRVFDTVGTFNERLRNCQDLEFWWRAALAGIGFAYTSQSLMTRKKYEDSLSSPSIATSMNWIACLDLCAANAEGREQLQPHLRAAYVRAWQSVARQYSLSRKRKEALRSVRKSLAYGLSSGTLYEALLALGGEQVARSVRRGMRSLVGRPRSRNG